jgi:D-threonate/D-erythronate kinase
LSLEIAIIADDLTGALDSAAPFAARGLRAVAALTPEALEEALGVGAEIVAVNTLTRHLPSAEAAAVAEQAAHRCLAAGAGSLFKKIDSRLRGNACVEAVAVAAAVGAGGLVVAPAVPTQGRVVTGGAVRGAGVEDADGIGIGALFAGVAAAGLELEFPTPPPMGNSTPSPRPAARVPVASWRWVPTGSHQRWRGSWALAR